MITLDKNAIKKYAVWARREMIDRVRQKAAQYGITDSEIIPADAISIDGVLLPPVVVEQRKALIQQLNTKGYREVMEEVAYTWFNRFIALRFMEVNGYLPSRVRVFTDAENGFHPQILAEAIDLELDGLDMEKIYALKNANEEEALYKYLLITQCNALNPILPGMFQKIADYTELLLPDNLLRDGSVIQRMTEWIPEKDWQDQVQIIGWLYQYYNSEKKDDVFAALKKNVKITKENIPAATQLFTPDWIVRYMVENSLGRLWIEGHPDTKEQFLPTPEEQSDFISGIRKSNDTKWHYFLEEAKQDPQVEEQLRAIRTEYAGLTPKDLKVIDPCCGSGHILVYMFDVLMGIYECYGYTPRAAVESILENNLYGLDIDDRAAQQAYFAVMMKAVKYDYRFLRRKDADGNPWTPQPHVYAIRESGGEKDGRRYKTYEDYTLAYFCNGDSKLKAAMDTILEELFDAKEYGSILNVTNQDWEALYHRFDEVYDEGGIDSRLAWEDLLPVVRVAEALAQKYDVVVTNPPYMGNMPVKMVKYVQKNYAIEKYDLYAVFIKRCRMFGRKNGYISMITQQAWLFLSSFEKLRADLSNSTIVNLIQLGAHAFEEVGGEVVQPVCFTLKNTYGLQYQGIYKDILAGTTQAEKEKLFFMSPIIVNAQEKYEKIPGMVIAYWIPQRTADLFSEKTLLDFATIKSGIVTGNNDYFLKLWYEIAYSNIGFAHEKFVDNTNIKWVPMHKGGGYRKHFGFHDYIMNLHDIWEPDKTNVSVRRGETDFYFKEGLTWSTLSNKLSVRRSPKGFVFDTKGSMCFPLDNHVMPYLEALLNSKIASYYMSFLSPTLDFNQGAMGKIPVLMNDGCFERVKEMSGINVSLCKSDWNAYETSWDFQIHPLLQYAALNPQRIAQEEKNGYLPMNGIADAYRHWEQACDDRFYQLKANEEELNRIFIDIYGLQDELTPEVEEKDVTVRKADLTRDVKSLISYAVGCMFGRYSLNRQGLVYAGGDWADFYRQNAIGDEYGNGITIGGVRIIADPGFQINVDGQWQDCTYPPEADNIIPISDDEYFEDDIVGRFVTFIETVYGKNTLEENLKFIANALGGKGQPRDVIRNYFLNDFFNDHCKIYQKRPIYWQFDSGKKNGFKALIYLHRYQPDTIARIRTDYVHEQQSRYRTAIADLEQRIAGATTAERVKLTKQLKKLQDQAEELHGYEEKIHHLADQMIAIDLDDGVKVNYAKFQDVLAKIK